MTLQLVRPISLADVRAEYGAPLGTSLGAFVRGGAWVPDTANNAGVPTAKPISLGDLLGSAAFTVTHTMVAGFSAPFTGFRAGIPVIGSIVPSVLFGEPINAIYHISSTGDVHIFMGVTGLAQNFWASMEFESADGNWDGVTLLSANADAFQNASFTEWTFNINNVFVNGQTYGIEWL